jgi:Fe-S-cluster containining protein
MAKFTCSRCGKCCQNFGPYLSIERELEGGQYYCRCSLTGEYFFARVTGTTGKEFAVKATRPEQTPCPFLSRDEGGIFTCVIYPTRPRLCREYRCSSMDILNERGERQGKVIGRRSLISKDQELISFWQKEIQPLQEKNDTIWRERAKSILEGRGYQVVLYE